MDILSYTAVELANAIRQGKTTAVAAMEAVLARIDQVESIYNCYITIDRENALAKAAMVQRQIEAGELNGPLAGVPFAIKDNLYTKGLRTTCGSKVLERFVPAYSAEVVTQLEEAGVIVVGKTNMDEFAIGTTNETSYFGVTRNPHGLEHITGGSSGGSAAAVAAGECFGALGTDTGGSVRHPASYCGVVGMKPTTGIVSRSGLIPYSPSLDQIGPVTRDVRDCAAVLNAIVSCDDKNVIKYGMNTDFMDALIEDVKDMRIGIPKNYFREGLAEEVREAVLQAAEVFRKKGAIVEEFDLSLVEYAVPVYDMITAVELSCYLEDFTRKKQGFYETGVTEEQKQYKQLLSKGLGTEVKRCMMMGAFARNFGDHNAYYRKSLEVRALMKEAFGDVFAQYDIILGSVAPTTAPKLGTSCADSLRAHLSDIYTVLANLAGLPAISIPCGLDSKKLPIGLHLMAGCFQDEKLLRAAYTYEQALFK